MAVQTNIELWAGDDRELVVTVRNDEGVIIPLDIAAEITWVMRERHDSTTNLIEKTLSTAPPAPGGITITDESGGEYTVAVDAADTTGLAGAYYWESVITDDSADVFTAAYGYVSMHGKGVRRGSYCTLEEAMALIADVQITANTTPSLATAQIILETIARDIDGVLMGRAYELPIEDEWALAFLKTLNQYGACAAIIKSKKPIDTGVASDRGAFGYYEEKYRAGLLQLANPDFNLLGSDTSAETTFAWGGGDDSWLDDLTEGEAENPFWTRRTYY